MDPQKIRHAISQFVAATVALLLLTVGCAVAILGLFGKSQLQTIATSEANTLSHVELSQLVGTPSYVKPTAVSTKITSAHHGLTMLHPLQMLQSVLPETAVQVAEDTNTQASLFQSITTWAASSNKIAMGWLPSTSAAACIQMLKDNPGITVASPTWLHLSDAAGNISGQILPSVVTYAHQHHIQVWALIDNQFNATLTHQVLQNAKARANLEAELVYQAKQYHLDGINVDFENVAAADRDAFTKFIQELHAQLSPLHIMVSVDLSPDIVQLRDNEAFFHAGLAAAADYVVLMAYDEHWSNDQVPGPVADVPWVENAVNDLLDTGVPTDKLIVGTPFYTRFWYVHNDGHVTSEAVSDANVQGILQAHHATGTWNANLGLMYAKYSKPDGYMEVWYDTPNTLTSKLSLVNDDGLAGVAVWSLELSDRATWTTLVDTLHQNVP